MICRFKILLSLLETDNGSRRKEKYKYMGIDEPDAGAERYRDMGILKYWFRAVESYAPWVNQIHFITWGHLPDWLNTQCPKLHIVNHKDYIPEDCLPVFSSHPIELNLHRIPDLAEHFIYFNDDVYLNNPTTPKTFFVRGLPRDTAVLGPVAIFDNFSYLPYITFYFSVNYLSTIFRCKYNMILAIPCGMCYTISVNLHN